MSPWYENTRKTARLHVRRVEHRPYGRKVEEGIEFEVEVPEAGSSSVVLPLREACRFRIDLDELMGEKEEKSGSIGD